MNILVLGKYYPPYCGGIETLTRNWAEGFARRGARVECVVANDRPSTQVEELRGVRVRRHARYGTAFSTALAPGYLTAARRTADVIQVHFPNPLADLALFLGRRRPAVVVTYHSDIVRQAGLMRFYRPLLDWMLGRADRIVVATPPQLEHSPVLPRFRAKCAVIPFGLELDRLLNPPPAFAPEIEAARAAAGGRPILLNIGRLVGYKGQRYLVEALARVDAMAWLVGSGPLRADLEERARAAGVRDRVRFWGEVPDELLPHLLHAADIFVLSSITPNEAFGLVQVEAMACAKPVICCQLPSGVPFVNQHGRTGLVVPPAEVGALAEAIRQLIEDPTLRRALGQAGRDRAIAEFSLETMVARYWNLFAETIHSRRKAG